MAYTDATEIQSDFKEIDFSTALVKTDSVEQFIVESDALINSYIGTVYVAPVTAGAGLNLLKLLSRSLTADRIKRILKVVQDTSKGANQNVRDTLLSVKDVMQILKDIQTKAMTLAGATLLVPSGGFYNNNVTNSVSPVIKKDERQW